MHSFFLQLQIKKAWSLTLSDNQENRRTSRRRQLFYIFRLFWIAFVGNLFDKKSLLIFRRHLNELVWNCDGLPSDRHRPVREVPDKSRRGINEIGIVFADSSNDRISPRFTGNTEGTNQPLQ